jgi:hypothetical protein
VLWGCLALIAVRGVGDILTGPEPIDDSRFGATGEASRFPDGQARAFAVRFAQAFLSPAGAGERPAGFLAEGLSDRATVVPSSRGLGAGVAWASVARDVPLGGSRALVTVAAFLDDGRVRHLTVPVARDGAGRLVVFDLPSFTAPPARGVVPAVEPVPLDGPGAGAVADLAERFVRAYVSGAGAGRLAYLLAPGVTVAPLGEGLSVVGVDEVGQAGDSDGPRRTVLVAATVRDETTGATYPTRYRLEVVRRDRWYVAAVQGGPGR